MARHNFTTLFGGVVLALLACAAISDIRATSQAAPTELRFARQRVAFSSGDLTLSGILFKPQGDGPFPALIWNHGSEKAPGVSRQLDTVASIFVPMGYVVFAPIRRGHGYSQGRYIRDVIDQTKARDGLDAARRMVVRLLETEQLDDQLTGLAYVKQLAFVDSRRLAVAGCSYGGIQTLLGAEKDAGYQAAISISPAALSWANNTFLQKRLIRSVQDIAIPVLLLQPARDASLEPSRVLGAEAARLGKPLTTRIYRVDETPPIDDASRSR
jgi:dipeptidyl aminopeptidase/acylaminoacyl peptidase